MDKSQIWGGKKDKEVQTFFTLQIKTGQEKYYDQAAKVSKILAC